MTKRFQARASSRRRSSLPPIRLPRWLLPTFVIVGLLGLILYWIDARMRPAVIAASQSVAHRVGAEALDNALTKAVAQFGDGNDLLKTTKPNPNDDLTITSIDMALLTKLQGDATERAQASLQELSNQDIHLPLVQIFSGSVLSGANWSVPVHLHMLGSVHSQLDTDVESRGVNQVVHIVYLDVTADVLVITPFVTSPTKIEVRSPVAYIVMSGSVPNAYYGPNALDGLPQTGTNNQR